MFSATQLFITECIEQAGTDWCHNIDTIHMTKIDYLSNYFQTTVMSRCKNYSSNHNSTKSRRHFQAWQNFGITVRARWSRVITFYW